MSDGLKFHFDEHEFGRALDFVEKEVGRTAKESINRAGLHVIIGGKGFKGAMQLTPKASKAAIKSIPYEELAGYVAAKLRAKGLIGKGSGRKWSTAQFKNAVAWERKRRSQASGYTAFAGWDKAARAFGGRGLKNVTGSANKLSRFGYGTKATNNINPVAWLVNTAPMAEKIGLEPLQKAITNVARDMIEWVAKKAGITFKKVEP